MQIQPFAGNAAGTDADLLILGVFVDHVLDNSVFKALDRALKGALKAALADEEFTGKSKQKLVLATLGALKTKRVALLGCGPESEADAATWLRLAGTATRLGNELGAKRVVLVAPDPPREAERCLSILARGALLGGYRFDRYLSDKGRTPSVARLSVGFASGRPPAGAKGAVERGVIVAEAVALARDLVNEPASDLYPESFATRAQALARQAGLAAKVLVPEALAKLKMDLLLGVGRGSERPPRLVHLTWAPKGSQGKPVVLVGKGITFDSGGLCLKQPPNMMDMKTDMAGAAAVLATLLALAKLAPKTTVHGLMALAENMPSGSAYRLGDVLRSAAGKTVEINNTDAEGRLVLADALHYARGLKPARIIDLATLTGACVVALGPYTTGVFSAHDDLCSEILAAALGAGESFWRLPLTAALKEQLKSDVADLKNTGQREGGAITAALFLKEFAGDVPWAHLDIAGPSTSTQDDGALAKGGTGVGVATLVDLLA